MLRQFDLLLAKDCTDIKPILDRLKNKLLSYTTLVKTYDALLARGRSSRMNYYPIDYTTILRRRKEFSITLTETQHTHSSDMNSTWNALLIALDNTSRDACDNKVSHFV